MHNGNGESPRMEAGLEHELAAKAVAPRITPADIEANIDGETYFTAADGVAGSAPGAAASGMLAVPPALSLLTFCVLVLRNGFTVTGKSAPASPANFDAHLGRKIARADAINQCWPLMGYALKQDLWRASLPQMTAAPTDYRDRVRAEHADLNDNLGKLETFIDSERFQALPPAERDRMRRQAAVMRDYSTVLHERIGAFK